MCARLVEFCSSRCSCWHSKAVTCDHAFALFYLSFSPTHSSRIVMDVVLLSALINRVGWRLSDAL
jgi:hypothetical protein